MHSNRQPQPNQSIGYAVLIGIGVMAGVDEIIFHQLLQWHHFYDLSTPAVGIFSDGLLHSAELLAIVAGFFLIADLSRKNALILNYAWSGFFIGAGSFQLFDGIINHKILQIHQIRYGVDIILYDLTWNLTGLVLLLLGLLLLYRANSTNVKNPVQQHH